MLFLTPQPIDGPMVPETMLTKLPGLETPVTQEMEKSFDKTSLQLSKERLEWLVQRAIQRIDEVKDEIGLLTDGQVNPGSFLDRRMRNQKTYDNDLAWREALANNAIFKDSNYTLGTNKRYTRIMSAKVRDDLLGTRPFFGCMKAREGDTELVKECERYVQERIDNSTVPSALREAQKVALIRDEAIVKTTYRAEVSRYRGPATVMVNEQGRPIITPKKGLYIYENDDFVPDELVQGELRLKKDPSFRMTPDQYAWADFPNLPQQRVIYDNVDSAVVETRDFLCPLNVRCVHEADINVHIYTMPLDTLKATYRGYDVAEDYFSNCERAAATQPLEQHGEVETKSRILKNVTIAEVYIRCDADEDNDAEEIFLVIDLGRKKAIFADYLFNHMPKRPFNVIPGVERVPGRWHCIGVFTMMEHPGLYIDTQFNRYNWAASKENRVLFARTNAVKEWKAGLPIRLNSDQIYTIEQGDYGPNNPPIFGVNQVEPTEHGRDLMQTMQQAGDLQFGQISAQDAGASGLESSKLATGIVNIERTANVLTKDTEREQAEAIEKILDFAVEVLLERMDEIVLQFSKDGSRLVTLSKEEIRSLERQMRLMLTRSRSTEQLAMNERAEGVFLRYMDLYDNRPMAAKFGRDFYVEQLKALEVMDADEKLPEVTDEYIQSWQQQRSGGGDKPPSESINYKDSPESIKRQMEAAAGYQPAPPEEIAQQKAEEVLKQQAELAAKQKQNERPIPAAA